MVYLFSWEVSKTLVSGPHSPDASELPSQCLMKGLWGAAWAPGGDIPDRIQDESM